MCGNLKSAVMNRTSLLQVHYRWYRSVLFPQEEFLAKLTWFPTRLSCAKMGKMMIPVLNIEEVWRSLKIMVLVFFCRVNEEIPVSIVVLFYNVYQIEILPK